MGKFVITDDNLLVTGIIFDRESLDHYDVIITATDKGVPPKYVVRKCIYINI